jgi:DNA-binding PadR family transcriptional regulator
MKHETNENHEHHHGHRHGDGGRGEGGRARRGELKYVLLDMLRPGPMHGYELIQAFDQRSGGRYVPSPGAIYPTLHKLEEFGLVSSELKLDKRDFRLTPAGTVLVDSARAEVEEFWQRWGSPALSAEVEAEFRLIGEEWKALDEVVNRRLLARIGTMDLATVQAIRTSLAAFRQDLQGKVNP